MHSFFGIIPIERYERVDNAFLLCQKTFRETETLRQGQCTAFCEIDMQEQGMDETESKSIAEAWLNFQKNWWAWDKLDELCRKDPKGAWSVLMELVEQAESKELLEDIGVGPLEDFVNYYAADFIDELESGAESSEGLAQALGYAQLRDASHPLAQRIAAIGCRTSTAGKQVDAFDDNE